MTMSKIKKNHLWKQLESFFYIQISTKSTAFLIKKAIAGNFNLPMSLQIPEVLLGQY